MPDRQPICRERPRVARRKISNLSFDPLRVPRRVVAQCARPNVPVTLDCIVQDERLSLFKFDAELATNFEKLAQQRGNRGVASEDYDACDCFTCRSRAGIFRPEYRQLLRATHCPNGFAWA